MQITINKEAKKILDGIKKNLKCSDSTAILAMKEFLKSRYRRY